MAINWANPLTSGLVYALPLQSPTQQPLVGDETVVAVGSPVVVETARGPELRTSSADYMNLGGALPLLGNEPFTLAMGATLESASTFPSLCTTMLSGEIHRFVLMPSQSTAYRFIAGCAGASGVLAKFAYESVVDTPFIVMVSSTGGMITDTLADWAAYIDGTSLGAAVSAPSFTQQTADVNYAGWDGADSKWPGLITDLLVWDRVLSAAEAAEYAADPDAVYTTGRRFNPLLLR